MSAGASDENGGDAPCTLINPAGRAPVVLVCEHASNRVPPRWGDLGLDAAALASHVAWDPGALQVARRMAKRLDAPLVAGRVSRLVYDCNRPPEAASAMPEKSETIIIPGNAGLSEAERAARTEAVYRPFEALLARTLDSRPAPPALVTVHSFTPVYHGRRRAVELGILHDDDSRLADAMLARAPAHTAMRTGRNDPYGPEDGVTHTLRRHALPRGLPNVMLEIRNDLIATPADQDRAAAALCALLAAALGALGHELDLKETECPE